MPITLYTGLPGHGKTSLMVEQMLAAAKKADRPVYAHGIDGLQDGIASDFDPKRWHEPGHVEDGALLFVDEAWKFFGNQFDAGRTPPPPHVLALAEHRHRGIDFVWTTQAPVQIFPFARTMIQDHHHVTRKFGTKMLEVFSWGELNEDVKSATKRENSIRKLRGLPKDAWAAYKSASVHTIKAKIPWRVVALPVVMLAAVALGLFAFNKLRPSHVTAQIQGHEGSAAGTAAPPSPAEGPGQRVAFKTAGDYAAAFTPLIPTMPWTAPAYASRSVVSKPTATCVKSEPGLDANGIRQDGDCRCMTEQGTRYNVTRDQCEFIVANGVYNPFKDPADETRREGRETQTATATPTERSTADAPAVAATPPLG